MAEQVSIQQIDKSNNVPIGSIEEAERENLDVSTYPTCARPNQNRGIRGCDWFDRCVVSAKGKNGPRNYGVEIVKGVSQGGGFHRMCTNCMWIAEHASDYPKNGSALKVVASEGETFEQVTSIAVDALTGEPCKQKHPNAVREKRRVPVKVEAYPRPGQNVSLLTDVLRAESIEAEKERLADEAKARAYGLEQSLPAIDERPAGSGKGRKTAG